jgi:hypothetical protein
MHKLLKLLGVLAIVTSSIDNASALSMSFSPMSATGTSEEFVFSYSGSGTFNLSSLSFSSPSTGNLLGGPLSIYTTSTGGSLTGSGTLSEIISTTSGKAYTASLNITGSFPESINVTLSPVPLPASFPLFAMALIGLGLIGYRAARTNSRFAV